MKESKTSSRGVSGRGLPLHEQGAEIRTQSKGETFRQSCPTDDKVKSKQIRIRLSAHHAERWLSLPPRLREQVASLTFGASTENVDLQKLAEVASELRQARLSINNVLQLALLHDRAPEDLLLKKALEQINALLGKNEP